MTLSIRRGNLKGIVVAGLCVATLAAAGSAPSIRAAGAPHHAQARYPAGTTVELHRKVVHVTVLNFKFMPASLVVSPGTRIIWTNQDSDPHTIDSTKNVWSSEALDTGDHFARTFGKAGTFPYYCSIHPFMHGTVIVKK